MAVPTIQCIGMSLGLLLWVSFQPNNPHTTLTLNPQSKL